MAVLSVNLNKIALLRNARGDSARPDLLNSAKVAVDAGAHGITVHPRPDLRHIKPEDVLALADWLSTQAAGLELNLEGNPFSTANDAGYPGFLRLIEQVRPQQCTLVPDTDNQLTSDHGFADTQITNQLTPILQKLRGWGVRSSIFMEPKPRSMAVAAKAGADRIELYTGPYAATFQQAAQGEPLAAMHKNYALSADAAVRAGLGVNAGHDLDLQNLGCFLQIKNILEVSIGHALIADALECGLANAIGKYLRIIEQAAKSRAFIAVPEL